MVRRTRVVYAAAALAAAALVFVGGFIVARSTEGRGPNGAPAAPDGRSEQQTATPVPPEEGECGRLADLLDGQDIRLGQVGFQPRLPGADFELLRVEFNAAGYCATEDAPAGDLVRLATTWLHRPTGYTVEIEQSPSQDTFSPEQEHGSLRFWDGGYQFSLSAYTQGPTPPATTQQEVLERTLRALAPTVRIECTFVTENGAWDDLAMLGIGDPRPALPSELVEASFTLYLLRQQGAGCNPTPPPYTRRFELIVSYGGAIPEVNTLHIRATAATPDAPYVLPGAFEGLGLHWATGDRAFSLEGHGLGQPIPRDLLVAIATAMDPAFPLACIAEHRPIDDSELAGLDLPRPTPPPGYRLAGTNHTGYVQPLDCTARTAMPVNLIWSFASDPGSTLSATLQRNPVAQNERKGGSFSDDGHGLKWYDGRGSSFTLFFEGLATPDRAALVAVAHSLDSEFDPAVIQ